MLAAEIPDLDYLWPAGDPVLHALKAHRGLSHSLLLVPVVALIAGAASKLLFRQARFRSLYAWSLAATLFAHLIPDAWTGWGTRLLLPFSDARVTLDWMMVVDPIFTAPLLVGALWGIRKRTLVRRAILLGFGVSTAYLGLRIAVKAFLTERVERSYPEAELVHVFPSWVGPIHWRYVARLPQHFAVGSVNAFSAPTRQALHATAGAELLSPMSSSNPTVREALAWARFPLVQEVPEPGGGALIEVADLRYHLKGEPTLRFEVTLDERARVVHARLERGGSARSLLQRFRAPAPPEDSEDGDSSDRP